MDGRINVAEAPEIMVSRRPPNPFEKANPAWMPRPNSPLEITPHKAGVVRDGLMTALQTLIDVAAQRGGATAPDRSQHTQLLVIQPGVLIEEAVTLLAEYIGHLHGRPGHFGLRSLRERGTWVGLEVMI